MWFLTLCSSSSTSSSTRSISLRPSRVTKFSLVISKGRFLASSAFSSSSLDVDRSAISLSRDSSVLSNLSFHNRMWSMRSDSLVLLSNWSHLVLLSVSFRRNLDSCRMSCDALLCLSASVDTLTLDLNQSDVACLVSGLTMVAILVSFWKQREHYELQWNYIVLNTPHMFICIEEHACKHNSLNPRVSTDWSACIYMQYEYVPCSE